MSIVRKSATSDVYIFEHVDGHLVCCGCELGDRLNNFECPASEPWKMGWHLVDHVAAGHRVPVEVFATLAEEHQRLVEG